MKLAHHLRDDNHLTSEDCLVVDGLRIVRYNAESPAWVLDGVRVSSDGCIVGLTSLYEQADGPYELIDRIPRFLRLLLDCGCVLSPEFVGRLNGVRDGHLLASLRADHPGMRISA